MVSLAAVLLSFAYIDVFFHRTSFLPIPIRVSAADDRLGTNQSHCATDMLISTSRCGMWWLLHGGRKLVRGYQQADVLQTVGGGGATDIM